MAQRYDAILFDLLTALLDSWTVWNQAAGSEAQHGFWGRTQQAAQLRLAGLGLAQSLSN